VSAPIPPEGAFYHDDGGPDAHAAAAAALRAAFARLQPQGSDAWNFLAAFTHLGDRYGPYHPGASELSKSLEAPAAPPARRAAQWKRRLRQKTGRGGGHDGRGTIGAADAAGEATELALAMAQVVEAFRFLSARVRTLEQRLAYQDRPVDGPAWLMPARELGQWVEPVTRHIVARTPGGEVLHGDCGEGLLLCALEDAGVTARGAEPRGTVALGALERGGAVAVGEVAEELAARPSASLGGLVLSGVVDRLPLHSLLPLLAQARRALAPGAPIVVVASDPEKSTAGVSAVARDLLHPRPLHAETWNVLLHGSGFVTVGPLDFDGDGDDRFAIAATTPT
jgi:hypothetical protein